MKIMIPTREGKQWFAGLKWAEEQYKLYGRVHGESKVDESMRHGKTSAFDAGAIDYCMHEADTIPKPKPISPEIFDRLRLGDRI